MRAALAIAIVLAGLVPAGATQLPNRIAMIPTTTGAATPLPMLDSKLDLAVRGPIIEGTVTQTFKNDTDKVTEATYIFPLPPDASVSAMSITTGATTIHAKIEKRADAQKRYEAAVSSGVRAATLEQERPDVFTQTVSAIPARGTVSVTIRFDTVARYRNGSWELAVPLVVAPRFVPGTASGRPTTGVGRAPDTDRAPDASRVTPNGTPGAGGKTDVTLTFADAVDNVTSPSHALTGSGKSYKLVDPKSDHDMIVRWHAQSPMAGWVEQGSDGGYAAIVVESGAVFARKPGMARSTLVIDRAATTRGDADVVMHPLVRALFGKLDPADRIAVAGSDTIAMSAPRDVAAAVERAWAKPAGAFDLTRVLTAMKPEGAGVILVSDGLVADDAAAITAAGKLGVPIHVIGVGPAPNRSLLGSIASISNGTIRFASTADDFDNLAREVIADVANPPQPVAITWGTLGAYDQVPATLPRLGAGQAMLVLARTKAVAQANGRARDGVFAMTPIATQKTVDGATSPRGVLARRWGRDRLEDLLAKRDATATTNHALAYGLVSPYTTMVAIGDEVVVEGGVKHSVPVPVSVPAGMKWQDVQKQTRVDTTVAEDKDTTKQTGKDVVKTEGKKSPDPTKERPAPDKTKVTDHPTGGVVAPTRPTPTAPPTTTVAVKPDSKPPEKQPKQPTAQADGDTDDDPVAKKKKHAYDDGIGSGEDEEMSAPAPMSPGATSVASARRMTDREDIATIETTGMSYDSEMSSGSRLRKRLALSLGGGLVIDDTSRGLIALDGRFEVGRANMVGLDAGLWLVDGLHAQGRTLASYVRRGILEVLEVGLGFGAQFGGEGVGPAWSFSLRGRPHTVGFGGFLRYDGSFLYDDDSKHGQHAVTIGVEATF